MIRITCKRTALAALLLATAHGNAARADLFALNSTRGEIYRINADTFEITRTYVIPTGPIGPSLNSGLAFDGRLLSWTKNPFGFTELEQFDVLTETWLGPIPIFDPILFGPIAGLGHLSDEFGGALIGVSRPGPPDLPAELYRIEPFGFALPLGELPVQYRPFGLDVDSATGEIWIAVQDNSVLRPKLIQISLGNLLQQVTAPLVGEDEQLSSVVVAPGIVVERELMPPLLPGGPIRSVAFEGGRMFGISTNRFISEIDRTTGELLSTVQLPVVGLIAGFTGGKVIPEPASTCIMLFALAPAFSAARRHNFSRCNVR